MTSIEQPYKPFSARELMKLPYQERNRVLLEAINLAADEDFEIFEAYSQEDFDDEYPEEEN